MNFKDFNFDAKMINSNLKVINYIQSDQLNDQL